jgi:hypothetical protein
MYFVLNTNNRVNIKRSNGHITPGYLQGQVKGRKDLVMVAWKDEQGRDVGKFVDVKEFVELNSTYAYLLPVVQPNTVTFTFSQEQVEAFQKCADCPPCFRDINCDSNM